MTLDPVDSSQFFDTWMPLLDYANSALQVVDSLKTPSPETGRPRFDMSRGAKVRDALWQDDSVLDRFVSENPAGLTEDSLALAASWKHRVTGRFTILRQLKKHAIFIQDNLCYGVLGLTNEIDEIVPFLPIIVDVTLLPFRDRIVSDGLFISHQIYLGPGIRADLNSVYKSALEGNGLITSLPMASGQIHKNIADGNAKLLKAFRSSLAGGNLTERTLAGHVSNIAGYADELLACDPPRALIDADLDSAQAYLANHPNAATSLKRFARFLFETGRGNADNIFELQELRRR